MFRRSRKQSRKRSKKRIKKRSVEVCVSDNKYEIFTYNGKIKKFIPKTSKIHVTAFGARGGYGNLGGGTPGKGGMISGFLKVKKGVPLYVKVGGASNEMTGCNIKKGGGATDIRLKKNDLYSRILVAGGGGSVGGYNGGKYGNNPHPIGGSGGGIYGGNSSGEGGKQTRGGFGGRYSDDCIGNDGVFGYGGEGDNICGCNGGGGDGWYGGASGTNEGGGGGGSNYIIPGSFGVKHKRGVNNNDGFLILSW